MTRARTVRRRQRGSSLVEVLVTVSLLGLFMGVLTQLAVTLTTASIKIGNRVDGQGAARIAMNRILADVRQARSIGDYYGAGGRFPATTNPIYGSTPPVGGWPTAPWNPNMTLSEQVLVLQIPVFYQDKLNPDTAILGGGPNNYNGFPTMLTISPGNPSLNVENLDTVVYQVVEDQQRPGEYVIQVARFPGAPIDSLNSISAGPINPPQTILKGLVGPKTATSTTIPSVFTYLGRSKGAGPYKQIVPNAGNLAAGVGIDLEIKKTGVDATVGPTKFPEYFGIHQEAYMASNNNMTLNNDR